MSDSEETLQQEPTLADVMSGLADINKRLDAHDAQFEIINKKLDAHDAQFETIREGIVHNSVAFDRLQSVVFSLRADVRELTEEVRQNRKTLSLK